MLEEELSFLIESLAFLIGNEGNLKISSNKLAKNASYVTCDMFDWFIGFIRCKCGCE